MKKTNINKLYFGIAMLDFNTKKLEVYNLFRNTRVKWSIAKYITMSDEEKKSLLSDPLHFCFGDTWGRCEYEFVVCPWGGLDKDDKVVDVGQKVDIFQMYVEPNKDLLMEMVNNVSENSAREFLREERKRLKGRK